MAKSTSIHVSRLDMRELTVALVGLTGLYCHRMSAKAKRQLMLGGRKKTTAERLEIKHDPRAEFVSSMHVMPQDFNDHSAIAFPAMAIKSAMATAALVVPGVTKANVQRLVYLPDEFVPIFGIPTLRMDITRSADMNRTPDVRTRAYFQTWATQVTINYAAPALSAEAISNLLYNAGLMCGIGDFRQEKGKGNFGTFEPHKLTAIPAELLDRDAQIEALQNPVPANAESAELLAEFDSEVVARQ